MNGGSWLSCLGCNIFQPFETAGGAGWRREGGQFRNTSLGCVTYNPRRIRRTGVPASDWLPEISCCLNGRSPCPRIWAFLERVLGENEACRILQVFESTTFLKCCFLMQGKHMYLELQNKQFLMVVYQLDDEPNVYILGKCAWKLGNHHFHAFKCSCLEFQVWIVKERHIFFFVPKTAVYLRHLQNLSKHLQRGWKKNQLTRTANCRRLFLSF